MKKTLIKMTLLFPILAMLFFGPVLALDFVFLLPPLSMPERVWDGTTDLQWSGTGLVSDPYLITSAEELAGLAAKVNSGSDYKNIYFKMINDLRLSQDLSKPWTPIGNRAKPFRGSFDGNGHTIFGLYIYSGESSDIGLFGSIGVGGQVKNLSLSGGLILGKSYVGSVAGFNTGLVENCANDGQVFGAKEYIGGLVGYNGGAIVDSYNRGKILGSGDNCDNLGGITGFNKGGIIAGCYNNGAVYGHHRIGGIVGRVGESGIVLNSWNTGGVTSRASEVGGITGHNSPGCIVANCYNTGDIKGTHRVGGLTGYNHGGVTINGYNIGSISGNSNQTGIGAVVGYNDDKALGVTGFMGGFDITDKAGYVVNCYWLAGSVIAGGGPRSGVGANDDNCSIIGLGKFASQNANIIASDTNRGGSTWLSSTIEFTLGKAIEVGIDIVCQELDIKVPESLKNLKINIDSQPAFSGNTTVYTGTLLSVLNQGFGADEEGNYGKWYQFDAHNGGYPILVDKTDTNLLPPSFIFRPIELAKITPVITQIEINFTPNDLPEAPQLNLLYPLDQVIESNQTVEFLLAFNKQHPNPQSLIKEWYVRSGSDEYYLPFDEETIINGCTFAFENDNLLRVEAGTISEAGVFQIYCDVSTFNNTVRSRVATLTVDKGEVEPYTFPFADVPEGMWYRRDVELAHKSGLINGISLTAFAPDNSMTVAEAIKLAACMHQLYYEGTISLVNGNPWYKTYVNYALFNGIINGEAEDYNAKINRDEFVSIFYRALPVSSYIVRNTVAADAIPDLPSGAPYANEIYAFYKAGILVGSDGKGTFHPATNIKRSEVAAILTRMFDETARKNINLP